MSPAAEPDEHISAGTMLCLQTLCRHPEVLKMALSNSGWGTKLTYLQSQLLGDFQVGGGKSKTSALYQDGSRGSCHHACPTRR